LAEDWGDDDEATQIALRLAKMGPKAAIDELFTNDPFGVYEIASFADYKCPKALAVSVLDTLKMSLETCFKFRNSSKAHPFLW
jgi:hypothetical protein